MNHRRWKVMPPVKQSEDLAGFHPLVAQLLYNRGITQSAEVEAFLQGDERLQGDPFLLPDMDKAVARIYRALLGGEYIAVYGDFDADGVCGVAVLSRGLSLLGARTTQYIPHRTREGYGLNTASLERLRQQGVTLVITVDCGISNYSEVETARKSGLDIIITDHHVTPPQLPPALAVVNPKRRDSIYPFSQLAGVGVAFKLIQGLYQTLGKELPQEELLDVVALGTIADMVPMLGENRYLVKEGLKALSNTRLPGLREMASLAGLSLANLSTEDITWVMVPRINAPGRLDHALPSYKLLATDSQDEACYLARELAKKNTQRQKLTEEFFTRAREQLFANGIDSPVLIAGGEDYPPGITGLIAGRLTGEFYRPSIVFEQGEDLSSGSARSISEFNIVEALRECQDLLTRFGGHAMAAGFALPTENLDRFRKRLLGMAAEKLSGIELCPFLNIDAEIGLSDISWEVFNLIEEFAPFGQNNPIPAFLSSRVRVIDARPVGAQSRHLKLKLREGDMMWPGIGFNLGHLAGEVTPEIDIVYNITVDRWNGDERLDLNILDFAPVN